MVPAACCVPATTPTTVVPQTLQNEAPGTSSAPQVGQRAALEALCAASGEPQPAQNVAPSTFCVPHSGQNIFAPTSCSKAYEFFGYLIRFTVAQQYDMHLAQHGRGCPQACRRTYKALVARRRPIHIGAAPHRAHKRGHPSSRTDGPSTTSCKAAVSRP